MPRVVLCFFQMKVELQCDVFLPVDVFFRSRLKDARHVFHVERIFWTWLGCDDYGTFLPCFSPPYSWGFLDFLRSWHLFLLPSLPPSFQSPETLSAGAPLYPAATAGHPCGRQCGAWQRRELRAVASCGGGAGDSKLCLDKGMCDVSTLFAIFLYRPYIFLSFAMMIQVDLVFSGRVETTTQLSFQRIVDPTELSTYHPIIPKIPSSHHHPPSPAAPAPRWPVLPAVSGRCTAIPRRRRARARRGAAGGAARREALAELRAQRAAMGGPAGRATAGPGGHGHGAWKGQEGKRNLGGQKLGWMVWFGRFSIIVFAQSFLEFGMWPCGIVMPSHCSMWTRAWGWRSGELDA